jgi:hypothetical protein
MTLTDAITSFANAIATAEGFFVSGSRPQRNNNPGDLTVDTTGTGIGKDGAFIVYATISDGWDALYKQVRLMLTDASAYYNSGMTIRDIASIYTSTEQSSWAANVANALGISIDVPISSLLTDAVVESAGIGAGVLLFFVAIWFMTKKKG